MRVDCRVSGRTKGRSLATPARAPWTRRGPARLNPVGAEPGSAVRRRKRCGLVILSVYAQCVHPGYAARVTVPLTILGLLEREPSHGYDLKRDYDSYFASDKPLPFGQVYATLRRLARDGKVAGGEAEPGA